MSLTGLVVAELRGALTEQTVDVLASAFTITTRRVRGGVVGISSLSLSPTGPFFVGLSVGEDGDGVEQQEECDHEERDPRVPTLPGSVPLSGGSGGVEVHAVILSSNSEAPLPKPLVWNTHSI